jgi:hypothetical protein
MTATATKQARGLVSRAVIWAGLALGTCLTVLAVRNGIRVPRLEVVLSVLATWALLTVLAVVAVELLRRHHRVLRHHGKRGAVAAAHGTRRRARSVTAWLAAKAAPRWQGREHRPLMFTKAPAVPAGPETAPTGGTMSDEFPEVIGYDEHGGIITSKDGASSDKGDWTRSGQRAGPPPRTNEGTNMSAGTSRIKTLHRAQRAAARAGGTVPAEWEPVIAQTADFEPEDDGELLEWMTRQVTGLSGWAEALVDFYEHCTGGIGIDPQAAAMLHDVADAAAGAAETMGAAKAKFTEHYELPREFAANGGLMTHDGRWVTGEGA